MHRSQVALIVLCCAFAASTSARSFSGQQALKFTEKVTALGPRPSGSPAIHSLQAMILADLKTTGCEITTDDFQGVTPAGPVAMRNILCRFPGKSGRAIVVSGHYDTKRLPKFVGANDGGSSTGFLLELAHALAGAPRIDDVWLVFFDGEEAVKQWTDDDSLYGSRHLASKWQKDGAASRIKALINVDMIGDKDLSLIYDDGSDARLRELVWRRAASMGYGREFPRTQSSIVDDHIPFVRLGVPALDLIDFNYGPDNSYWHTPQDSIDKLSAQSFTIIGDVLLSSIRDLEMQA
jgi:glutaminyl-peptide cyclotransferase